MASERDMASETVGKEDQTQLFGWESTIIQLWQGQTSLRGELELEIRTVVIQSTKHYRWACGDFSVAPVDMR